MVEQYELTEPFAALLDRGDTMTMVISPDDTATPSQTRPSRRRRRMTPATECAHPSVFRAMYGDHTSVTESTQQTRTVH
jgi:hypothetical protein